MRKIYLLIFFLAAVNGFSQNSSCVFSDGNYHYKVRLVIDGIPSVTFNKEDFVSYLEANSSISNSDIEFLNDNLIEVFREFPNSDSELSKVLYIISNSDSLDSFLTPLTESISLSIIYCECVYSDNYVYYYSKLIMEDIPELNFDKDDYIQHLELNSEISNNDIVFLNSVINQVYRAYPSSSNEDLQRGLFIQSSSDLLVPFLHDYTQQAIEFVENTCAEPQLSVDNVDLKENINIVPNPIIDDFVIRVNNELLFDKLIVYDITGKRIIHRELNNSDSIIKGDFKLNSGLYFFKFTTDKNTTITKKVVVK